jgi:hypothetical protein
MENENKKEAKRLYNKLRYEANKDKINDQKKAYYEANKDKIKEQTKVYYEANKEQTKAYYDANKDKIKEQTKEYKEQNKDKIKKHNATYRENNKDKINEYKRQYNKNRELSDPLFKLKHNIRSNISQSIKKSGFKKISKTEQILNCTFDEFRIHLESLWQPWMNWDNYGNPIDGILELNKTWDIDHKIPTSTATNEIELLQLNHYTNLQPLCSYYNRFVKSDNLI